MKTKVYGKPLGTFQPRAIAPAERMIKPALPVPTVRRDWLDGASLGWLAVGLLWGAVAAGVALSLLGG
jgi:hypothetical protein